MVEHNLKSIFVRMFFILGVLFVFSCKSAANKSAVSRASVEGLPASDSMGQHSRSSLYTITCKNQIKDYYCTFEVGDMWVKNLKLGNVNYIHNQEDRCKTVPVLTSNAGYIFRPANCGDVIFQLSYTAAPVYCADTNHADNSPQECEILAPKDASINWVFQAEGEFGKCDFSDELSHSANTVVEAGKAVWFSKLTMGEDTKSVVIRLNKCSSYFLPSYQRHVTLGTGADHPYFFASCSSGQSLCGLPFVDNIDELTVENIDDSSKNNLCKIKDIFASNHEMINSERVNSLFFNFEKAVGANCKITAKYTGKQLKLGTYRIWIDQGDSKEEFLNIALPNYVEKSMVNFEVPGEISFTTIPGTAPLSVNDSNPVWIIEGPFEGTGGGFSECATFAKVQGNAAAGYSFDFTSERVGGAIEKTEDGNLLGGEVNMKNPCAAFVVWQMR